MKFKHNDKVTCTIDGTTIKDARISISKDGTPYICQNEVNGLTILNKRGYRYSFLTAENKLGYRYSFLLENDFTSWYVSQLKLATEKTWDNLAKGDILINKNGGRIMVIETLGDIVFTSYINNFEGCAGDFSKKQLKGMNYTILGTPATETKKIEEMMKQTTYGTLICEICDGDNCLSCEGNGIHTWNVTTLGEKIKTFIRQAIADERKAFGGCTKCYGKGYSTQIDEWTGSGYSSVSDYYLPCSCDRGAQIKKILNK